MKSYIKSAALILFIATATSIHGQDLQLKENLTKHIYTLASDSLKGRRFRGEIQPKVVKYITDEFIKAGIPPMNDSIQYAHIWNDKDINIIGLIEGSDPVLRDEYVVIGAHYDHLGIKKGEVYPGADDNASGTAALIEVGRILAANKGSLKRSVIIVAFDGEEQGLLGSAGFVRNPPVPLYQIKLMINMDMVGYLDKGGKLEIVGIGMIKDGKNLVKQINANDINVKYKPFDTKVLGDSDHSSFANRKIPALYITTGTKPSPYHKPTDTADKIDYDGLVKVTDHVSTFAQTMADTDELAFSSKLAAKHGGGRGTSFGLSLNIGSNLLHYTSGPVEGKPAFSYGAGLYSKINLNKHFALRPEVVYERRNAKYYNGTFYSDAVSVPVSFLLMTPPGPVRFFAQLGCYYNYNFGGKAEGVKMDFDIYKQHTAGTIYGFGFELSKITIRATFKSDFISMRHNEVEDFSNHFNLNNRSLYFGMDFSF